MISHREMDKNITHCLEDTAHNMHMADNMEEGEETDGVTV